MRYWKKTGLGPVFFGDNIIGFLSTRTSMLTHQRIQQLLDMALELSVPIEGYRAAIGGSINEAYLVSLRDGRRLFLKTHRNGSIPGMYAAEFRALELLSEPGHITVPRPLYADEDFLVMEAFEEGVPAYDWQEQVGRGLARLHQATRQKHFGFDTDNYLGQTLQPNTWQEQWILFWQQQRLGYQLELLRGKVSKEDPLVIAVMRLLDALDDVLASDQEPAVLLHGDLWSGNAAANTKGQPVIFDPASYYGHREAELGMMRLFGGFGVHCEAAYQEVWPFQPGFNRRIDVYRLYHQLNHLNLFGGGYYSGCLDTARGLL